MLPSFLASVVREVWEEQNDGSPGHKGGGHRIAEQPRSLEIGNCLSHRRSDLQTRRCTGLFELLPLQVVGKYWMESLEAR